MNYLQLDECTIFSRPY